MTIQSLPAQRHGTGTPYPGDVAIRISQAEDQVQRTVLIGEVLKRAAEENARLRAELVGASAGLAEARGQITEVRRELAERVRSHRDEVAQVQEAHRAVVEQAGRDRGAAEEAHRQLAEVRAQLAEQATVHRAELAAADQERAAAIEQASRDNGAAEEACRQLAELWSAHTTAVGRADSDRAEFAGVSARLAEARGQLAEVRRELGERVREHQDHAAQVLAAHSAGRDRGAAEEAHRQLAEVRAQLAEQAAVHRAELAAVDQQWAAAVEYANHDDQAAAEQPERAVDGKPGPRAARQQPKRRSRRARR
jgi:chromosome segregation ATPase